MPRDLAPTRHFPDIVRMLHRDPSIVGEATDGWPSPATPRLARSSLCDVHGRRVSPVSRPGADQARDLLTALGADTSLDALVGQTGQGDAMHGDVLVDPLWIQDPPRGLPELRFIRGLDHARAAALLTHEPVSHMWSDRWLIRCDPWGEASSSLVLGVAGTAHRLQSADLAALPVGHAWPWPPPCRTCGHTVDPDVPAP